jgi:hypothetical protein
MLAGCNTGSGNVRVYDGDGAGVDITHEEKSMTAVVSDVDVAANTITFVDCASGAEKQLLYNGGVTLKNSYNNDIDFEDLSCGEIMDVTYYSFFGGWNKRNLQGCRMQCIKVCDGVR